MTKLPDSLRQFFPPTTAAKVWANPLLGHAGSLVESHSRTEINYTSYNRRDADLVNGGNVVAALKAHYDPNNEGLVTVLDEDSQGRLTTVIFTGTAKTAVDADFNAMLEEAKNYTSPKKGLQPG